MKTKLAGPLLLLLLLSITPSSNASPNLKASAGRAISENPAEARPAIAELRAAGPAGLHNLFELYGPEIEQHITDPLEPATPQWLRLTAALDAVSQQKDSYLAGLYWYTDLKQAEAVAKSSGKPILSLRLLGNLNEEFSCANSRFFRSVLYPNAAVSAALRERFVLHWQSVRPVPRVTIDFGDGRKLERTITGNSIHYILDSEGRILDALPGLYGPQAFLRQLNQTERLFARLSGQTTANRFKILDEYHRLAVKAIAIDWQADAKNAGGRLPTSLLPTSATDGRVPRAREIAPLAITKMVSEISILKAITKDADALGLVTDEATWTSIARRHSGDARLDQRSIGMILRQTPNVRPAEVTVSAIDRFSLLLQNLQLNIALDTVRNEYMMHTQLHAWLIADPLRYDLNAFNEKVYAQLFLTPRTDPWLGLFSDDTYVGLENGGVVRTREH